MLKKTDYRDIFNLHQKWNDPPATEQEWDSCVQDFLSFIQKGGNTPFVNDLATAVYKEIVREYEAKGR